MTKLRVQFDAGGVVFEYKEFDIPEEFADTVSGMPHMTRVLKAKGLNKFDRWVSATVFEYTQARFKNRNSTVHPRYVDL